jgi:hypothetical protein
MEKPIMKRYMRLSYFPRYLFRVVGTFSISLVLTSQASATIVFSEDFEGATAGANITDSEYDLVPEPSSFVMVATGMAMKLLRCSKQRLQTTYDR